METKNTVFDNFYVRLRQAREDAGLSVADIAKALGMGKHTYYNYEAENPQKRALPRGDTLLAISRVVGRSIDWLVSGEERAAEPTEAEPMEGFTFIPRYDVECSAGGGAFTRQECVVESLPFKNSFLQRVGVVAREAALVGVTGDSMEPTLRDGDLLLLALADKQLKNGRLFAVRVDGNLLVKRVQYSPDGAVVLKSDNPRYDPFRFSREEVQRLDVVGRLVWAGRKL